MNRKKKGKKKSSDKEEIKRRQISPCIFCKESLTLEAFLIMLMEEIKDFIYSFVYKSSMIYFSKVKKK